MKRRQMTAAACLSWAVMAPLMAAAQAQPPDPIVIGQTAGFTGIVEAHVKEAASGARLYIDWINGLGGIHGRPLQLVQLDDQFDPRLAAENAARLITEHKATALFLTRGTPHNEAIMPLLTAHRIALVGPSTGAMVLHSPVHPYVFNVRATYQREAEHAIRHLATMGLERIAVLQVDDSFGADAMAGASKGFTAGRQAPLVVEKFDRARPNFSAIAPRIVQLDAQAVLFIGSGTTMAQAMVALRAAGSRAQLVTLSNNASAGLVKALGEHARGTIVTQVFPYERSLAAPLVKEALELLKAKGAAALTPAMMEGFASAKVLVEGLRRAGPNPTREKLVAALNNLRRFDLGGMEVNFTPTDHTGTDYSDLSIIGEDGRFRR